MALNTFSSGRLVDGSKLLSWVGVYDDVADTVTLDCTWAAWPSGEPLSPPTDCGIRVTQSNGQKLTVSFVNNGDEFDGGAPLMLNSGPRVRTNTRLKVSQGRDRALEHETFVIV